MPEEVVAAETAGAASESISTGASTGAALAEQPTLGSEGAGTQETETQGQDQQVGAEGQTATQEGTEGQTAEPSLPAVMPAELKALLSDPKVGRTVQSVWDQLQGFRSVIPTLAEAKAYKEAFASPEDALAAAQKAQALDDADSQFLSANPQERTALAEEWYRDNPAAFARMVSSSLEYLGGADPRAFGDLAGGLVGQSLKGERFDFHVEQLRDALRSDNVDGLKQLVNDLVQWSDAKGYSAQQKLQSPQQLAMDRERQQIHREQESTWNEARELFRDSIKASLGPQVWEQTQAILTPLLKTLPFNEDAKKEIAEEVLGKVDQQIRQDRNLQAQIRNLVPEGGRPRTDERTKNQIINLIVGRSRALLPTVARQVVSKYSSFVVAANKTTVQKKGEIAARKDVTGGQPPAGKSRVPTLDESRKMSESDLMKTV